VETIWAQHSLRVHPASVYHCEHWGVGRTEHPSEDDDFLLVLRALKNLVY
jgi:hypothetical protein